MIKRSHVQQFLAVVDTGSFTLAARRIRVTQPTLSSGIAELERLTGTRLFIRDRRHIRLTEAGGNFLPIARDLQRGFRAADAFAQMPALDWPQLKLGTIRTIRPAILRAVVAALASEFSLEVVEANDPELRAGMGSGRIDAALGLLRPNDPEAEVIPLLDEPYVMFVAEGHRLAGKAMVHVSELASEVMIARRSCEVLDETSRIFTRHGVRPRFAFRSESDDHCLELVAAGIGVTTAPLSFQRTGITPIRVAEYDLGRRVGLRLDPAWRKPGTGGGFDRIREQLQHFADHLAQTS